MIDHQQFDSLNHLVATLCSVIAQPQVAEQYFCSHADDYEGNYDEGNKLSAAMAALANTMLALSNYLRHGLGRNDAERYLRLYGVLHAAFLQQDAIRALWESVIAEPFPEHGAGTHWKELRELRNHATGHPIELKRKRLIRRSVFTRIGLTVDQVELSTYDSRTDDYDLKRYSLAEILRGYFGEASSLVENILDAAKQKWTFSARLR